MSAQKFKRFDHVMVDKDLGSSMSHFQSGVEAIVIGSYTDQYGGRERDDHEYTLHIKDHGQVSWYHEHQLTLISTNAEALYNDWVGAAEQKKKQERDLDWIFSEGHKNKDFQLPGDSAQALADELGAGSLWGSRGEGWVWQKNYAAVWRFALPFLLTGDKEGFLAACETVKQQAIGQKPEPCTPPYHPPVPEPEPLPADKGA